MPLYRSQSALIFFVHIPKAGGTSIENALKNAGVRRAMIMSKAKNLAADYGRCTPQHIHANVYKRYLPKSFLDYAFTVVRNPYGRIASEYKMKVMDGKESATPSAWIMDAIKRYKKFSYTRDNHIRPQVEFLAAHVEQFRLEDGLDKPLQAAFRALGLPAPEIVPHNRKGSAEKLQINAKALKCIRDFYSCDFEHLGYDINSHDEFFNLI
jgi:hypothetical protein